MGGFLWSGDRREERRLLRDGLGDCEAFLHGRLAERLEARGVWVPAWAWTNMLAHGEEQDLRDDRAPRRAGLGEINDRWRRARAYLASEVLLLAEGHGPLVVLQERILRPLELDLAVAPCSAMRDPSEWAVHVSSVLDEHRTCERRTSRHGTHHH